MKDKLLKIKDWILQHTIYKQFIPSAEDLEVVELEKLSKRLKTDSINETLINILEWQDRNVKYWDERAITSSILTILLSLSIMLFSIFLGKTNNLFYLLMILIPFLIIGNITFSVLLYLIVLLIIILTIPFSLSIVLPKVTLNSGFVLLFLISSFILGALIFLIFNLVSKYRNIKRFIPEFEIEDTFKLSLPLEKILKYNLSICRDYAKLTSALLLKIFPKEVYFTLIPQHVAVAVKIKDTFFVLDQKLPILTLNNWYEKWKKRFKKDNLKFDLVRIYLDKGKIRINSIKKQDGLTQRINDNEIKFSTNEIRSILNLKKEKKKPTSASDLEIPFKDFGTIYTNNELVRTSFLKLVKNRIENELVGNINSITYLTVEQKDNDLILKIWLK